MECIWRPQTEAGDAPEIGLPFSILPDWTSHTPRTSALLLVSFFFSSFFFSFIWFPPIWELGVRRRKVISNPNQHSEPRVGSDVSSHPQIGPPSPPLVEESFGRMSLSDFCACAALLLVVSRGWGSSRGTNTSLPASVRVSQLNCLLFPFLLFLALEWFNSAWQRILQSCCVLHFKTSGFIWTHCQCKEWKNFLIDRLPTRMFVIFIYTTLQRFWATDSFLHWTP